MSFTLMAQAMPIKTGSPITKAILLKLCDNANDNGECWPSHKNIADNCEVSRNTVIRHIQKLIELKLISKENRFNDNKKVSNKYLIHLVVSENDYPSIREIHGVVSESYIEPITIEPIIESKKELTEKLPDFIDKHIWDEFKAMRKEEKKPLNSQRKIDGVIKLLTEYEAKVSGEANRSLEQSIDRCWISVFETNASKNKNIVPKKLDNDNWDY